MFVSVVFFFSGLFSLIFVRNHYLMSLLSIEFLVVSIYFFLVFYYSLFVFDYFFSILFLVFMVCDSSLGLATLVYLIRKVGNDYLDSMTFLC